MGTAAGIFGAVMGFLGYKRSSQIKSLDLRLELRKAVSDSHTTLATLRGTMDLAARSRPAVLAAQGLYNSGNRVVWEQALNTDKAEVDRLAASIRGEDADYSALSSEALESEIVASHKVNTVLNALIDKYRGELATDDEARRQIAQFHHDRVNATRK
ncbi:hypothetical protein ACFQ3P_32690 [Paraburkholderia sabiae]|uniref:hypothetical protein n=1 Tax=Paraburkholderia sabiae TaxID=273251 RepID=UPI00319E6C3A